VVKIGAKKNKILVFKGLWGGLFFPLQETYLESPACILYRENSAVIKTQWPRIAIPSGPDLIHRIPRGFFAQKLSKRFNIDQIDLFSHSGKSLT